MTRYAAFLRGMNLGRRRIKNDALMKNPTWYIQQAVTFLGTLNYSSPKVIAYLEAENTWTERQMADTEALQAELEPRVEVVDREGGGTLTGGGNGSRAAFPGAQVDATGDHTGGARRDRGKSEQPEAA